MRKENGFKENTHTISINSESAICLGKTHQHHVKNSHLQKSFGFQENSNAVQTNNTDTPRHITYGVVPVPGSCFGFSFLPFPLGYPRRHGNAPILSLLFPPQDFRLLFVFRFKFSVSSLHKKGFNHRRIKNTIMHISESCINILRGRREKQNIAAQKVEGEREERKNQQPKKTNQRI